MDSREELIEKVASLLKESAGDWGTLVPKPKILASNGPSVMSFASKGLRAAGGAVGKAFESVGEEAGKQVKEFRSGEVGFGQALGATKLGLFTRGLAFVGTKNPALADLAGNLGDKGSELFDLAAKKSPALAKVQGKFDSAMKRAGTLTSDIASGMKPGISSSLTAKIPTGKAMRGMKPAIVPGGEA